MNETLSPPSTAGTAAATMADTVEIRDDDGQLRHSMRLQDGELHGHVESYDERGQLMQRASYADGLRHGSSEYRDDGRLQMQQQYDKGQAHGPTVVYDPAGHVAAGTMNR